MKIAVVGGSGTAGRATVAALAEAGHEPLPLSRSTGVDVLDAPSLRAALVGVDAVVDATNVHSSKRRPAERFFEAATRNVVDAARDAGVGHLVVLSIVGIDRVPYGYYQGKVRQERVLEGSLIPVSILRATQFHEFAGQYLDRATGRSVIVPTWTVQPVAVREVGTALAELAAGPQRGRIEIAGPGIENMAEMVRRVAEVRGDRRRIRQLRIPGAAGRAMAGGGNTSEAPAIRGAETFSDWLRGDVTTEA